MKLTEQHAETLPHPYPEEKTFENPIYQVMKDRIYTLRFSGVECDQIYRLGGFQLSIDLKQFVFAFVSFTMFCDWLAEVPLSQPMRIKTKTNRHLISRVFPRLAPVRGFEL